MNISLKGLIELAGHEGVCLSPYLDSVGVWTIGFGATRSEIPGLNGSHPDITMLQAVNLFKKGIVKYENAVNKAIHVQVSQEQFDALCSICYNIGCGGLSGSTFVKRINAQAPMNNIIAAIMMWTKPKEITLRRAKEAKLFSNGVYSNGGKCLVFPTNGRGHTLYAKGKSVNVVDLIG